MRPTWQGVFPAVTTQFRADMVLDLGATERHLAVLLDSGVRGRIVCGSLGETEREQILKIIRHGIEHRHALPGRVS